MHGLYTYLEANPDTSGPPEPRFHELSHGESFLAVLETPLRLARASTASTSPRRRCRSQSTLGLVAVLHRLVAAGGQVLCATHSPVLAALPGANLLEVGDRGACASTTWEDLELVGHWRRFLDAPERYLRHLTD